MLKKELKEKRHSLVSSLHHISNQSKLLFKDGSDFAKDNFVIPFLDMKKSSGNYHSENRRPSRPNSAKANLKKLANSSLKKDSSLKNISTKSKGRDRSKNSRNNSKSKNKSKYKKSKNKENSHSKRMEEQKILLSNAKTGYKASSMGNVFKMIDGRESLNNKPPKGPKQPALSFKEDIMMNIENLDINRLRSRQQQGFEPKLNTIQNSPNLNKNLEIKSNSLKRKSSFVTIKKDVGAINLNFIKSKRII